MTGRASFYVTRALIGALEGGFIPGTILFATYFYKTRELSTRLAFFWSSLNVCCRVFPSWRFLALTQLVQVARIISSLLAAGILQMRGVKGKSGWFWLFLIEGLLTFVIGVIVRSTHSSHVFSILTKAELVLSPRFANQHQKHSLSKALVYRKTGSDHGKCTSSSPFLVPMSVLTVCSVFCATIPQRA